MEFYAEKSKDGYWRQQCVITGLRRVQREQEQRTVKGTFGICVGICSNGNDSLVNGYVAFFFRLLLKDDSGFVCVKAPVFSRLSAWICSCTGDPLCVELWTICPLRWLKGKPMMRRWTCGVWESSAMSFWWGSLPLKQKPMRTPTAGFQGYDTPTADKFPVVTICSL